MKNASIKIKVLICIILSFIGFVNAIVTIWLGKKSKIKIGEIIGIIMVFMLIISIFIPSVLYDKYKSIIEFCDLILCLMPIIINFMMIGEFSRTVTLEKMLKQYQLDLKTIEQYSTYEQYLVPEMKILFDSKMVRTSNRVYGENGNTVLYALAFFENQQKVKEQICQEKLRLEKEKIAQVKATNIETELTKPPVKAIKTQIMEQQKQTTQGKNKQIKDNVNLTTEQELALMHKKIKKRFEKNA